MCQNCDFANDMIALAAAVWKLGIAETLVKLSQQAHISTSIGAAKAIDRHLQYFNKAEKTKELFKKSRDVFVAQEEKGLRNLQEQVGAYREFDQPALRRLSRFVGGATVELAWSHLDTNHYEYNIIRKTRKQANKRWRKLQAGSGWDDLLLIPTWNLPGRISGFIVIGRHGDRRYDWFYANCAIGDDPGLAMLPALFANKDRVKYIFHDVDIALRFHARQSRNSSAPLPIAATWDDGKYKTSDIWKWFSADTLVFWGLDPLESIAQACQANGKVSLFVPTEADQNNNYAKRHPQTWLSLIKRKAVPWKSALRQQLPDMSNTEIEAFLNRIDLTGNDLMRFIKGCDAQLVKRLRKVDRDRKYATAITHFNKQIYQTKNGWFIKETNEQICDMVVRIDKVLTTKGKNYYQGRVRFRGEYYDFVGPCDELDTGLFDWLTRYLRDTLNVGMPYVAPGWTKAKGVKLAMAFYKPGVEKGIDTVGWDSHLSQFNFNDFSVKPGGYTSSESPVFNSDVTPAQTAVVPELFPQKLKQVLCHRNDEVRTFWATAACVIANIIAPAVNRNRSTICLDGVGAKFIGAATARCLGCVAVPACADTSTILSRITEHNWPVLLPANIPPDLLLREHYMQNCILQYPWVTNRMLAINGDAVVVSYSDTLGDIGKCWEAAPYVIPHYLKWLCGKHLELPKGHKNFVLQVVDSLNAWFKDIGHQNRSICMAKQFILTPENFSVADVFWETLTKLYSAYVITEHSVVIDKDQVKLNLGTFCNAVREYGMISPDVSVIEHGLKQAGDHYETVRENGHRWWILNKSKWLNSLETWTENDKRK